MPRFAVLAVLYAGLVSGCGGSTTPIPVTPRQIALHFDSLYEKAENDALDRGRAYMVQNIEIPAAYGIAPTHVRTATDDGPAFWPGYVWQVTDTNSVGAVLDSTFYLVAYSDYDVANAVFAEITYAFDGDHPAVGVLLVNDSLVFNSGDATMSASLLALGADTCGLITGLSNSVVDLYAGLPCRLGTLAVQASLSFPGDTTANPTFQHVSLPMQQLSGARLVRPASSEVTRRGFRGR
jgi:hypothetical protein